MKSLKLVLLPLLITAALPSQSQVCDNEKETKEILKKHGNGRLETAAMRCWQLRAQSFNGQIGDQSGADYAVRNANEMHDVFYDHMKKYGAASHIPEHLHPGTK